MKDDLHQYLRIARANMLWKLDGLSEYEKRRPMTPTGTNLLGLVKHLAIVEYGYFGLTFGIGFGNAASTSNDVTGWRAVIWRYPIDVLSNRPMRSAPAAGACAASSAAGASPRVRPPSRAATLAGGAGP